MATQPWSIARLNSSLFTLDFPVGAPGASVMATADHHFDNRHCDLRLLAEHLQLACDRETPVVAIGDIFCAMQGKWDKRKDPNQLREEHRGANYLDRLVDTAVDFYAPYAKSLALFTPGNHETSIQQLHETDLLARLVERLRALGSPVQLGAYAGFMRVRWDSASRRIGSTMFWHHGSGGGGEVTRGFIDHSRTRSQVIADVYVHGHIHRKNVDAGMVEELEKNGLCIVRRPQLFVRCASYKTEGVQQGGWHVATGKGARPEGGWIIEWRTKRDERDTRLVDVRAVEPWS